MLDEGLHSLNPCAKVELVREKHPLLIPSDSGEKPE